MSKTALLFIGITLLAGFFRLTNLNLIEFKTDEALNLFLATRPLFGHPFPAEGTVSSVGIPNPPLFNYILFPIVFFTLNPKTITFFIALANTMAIGFLFLLIKRYYSTTTAVITSILFAISPWAILYSRKIWAPDILLPFLIGLLWSSHKIAIDNRKKYWTAYFLFSLLLVQLHQSSLFFLTPITLFLVIRKRQIFSFRYAFFGFILGIIPLLPFLHYEIQNRCPDCSTFLAAEKKVAAVSSPTIFMRNFQITGTGDYTYIFGVDDFLVFQQTFPIAYKLRYLLYFIYPLLPIGMYLFYKKNQKLRFIVYTTFATPLLYYLFKIEPLMHYYIVLLPFLFIFLSYPFAYLFKNKSLFLKGAFFVLFISFLAAYCIFDIAFINFLNLHKGTRGDYGSIFSETEKNNKKDFAHFSQEKNFSEIIIASYLRSSTMIDNLSLARMLYPTKQTEKNLPQLENTLKHIPDNPIILLELTGYFRQKINNQTIIILRNKAHDIPAYEPIYQQIYSIYLGQKFKRAYTISKFPIAFEYPSHWTVKEIFLEQILIYGDISTLSISTQQPQDQNNASIKNRYLVGGIYILGKQYKKTICITQENYWCGTTYEPFPFGKYTFFATLQSKTLLKIDEKDISKMQEPVDEILTSLRSKY